MAIIISVDRLSGFVWGQEQRNGERPRRQRLGFESTKLKS